MSRVIANSLAEATPLIQRALTQESTVSVWLESEKLGYWATLKLNAKPVAEMSAAELKADLRRMARPQPYDIEIIPWGGFMYRGYHNHKPSSAF